MYRHALIFFLLLSCSTSHADDWKLVPSVDGYWIKASNKDNHQLIVIRKQNISYFMLILATDSPPPDNAIPVRIAIDKSQPEDAYLKLLEKRPDQSIFQIDFDNDQKDTYITRMIAGLKISFIFNGNVRSNTRITFSLKGFTAVLNDLLIADDIGSLDQGWLLKNHKDHELFCYIMSNISIEAMQLRIKGYNYSGSLHSIQKTGHSIIDNNLANIIQQVYNIPENQLPSEPKAEKYMIFRNCLKQRQQQIH